MLSKSEIEIMASLGKHRVARENLKRETELFNTLKLNCPHYIDCQESGYHEAYCNFGNSQSKCQAISCPLDPLYKKEHESHPGVSWYAEQ